MSKHNRERRLLWKLGLHKKQIGRKVTRNEIVAAKQNALLRQLQERHERTGS